MKVLIGCETSGTVRDAFIRLGHDAISCDLEPSDSQGPHIQDDILKVVRKSGWGLLIAHPPCTDLAVSGAAHFKYKEVEQKHALEFVFKLMAADIPKIAIENPVSIISRYIKPTQIIQPWMFGHPEAKATCLWLKNLPKLVPTDILELPIYGHWYNQTPSRQNKLGPDKHRAKIRSKTYANIAKAMAEQWSS